MRKGWLVGVLLLAGCADVSNTPSYSSNPPAESTPEATCQPTPCILHQGTTVSVDHVVRDAFHHAGFTQSITEVWVKWSYHGSKSDTAIAGQLYLIVDGLVKNETQDSGGGVPNCAPYSIPEMADGGSFGPKAVCFITDKPPTGPLTLRWKHSIFGGPDQDLLLP